MTLSIRMLLIFVGFIAFATAALINGGIVAILFQLASGACLALTLITAAVAINRPRAIALGFIIPASLYALLLIASGAKEFHFGGSFPTSRLAAVGYEALYLKTGKVVALAGEPPNPVEYFQTFHAFVLSLFGMAGAFYARWLYTTQSRKPDDG